METEFIDLSDLFDLKKGLERADEKAINKALEEISRLQSIIKDYELGMRILNEKFKSKQFKKPKK